jgi:integrase
MSCSVMQGLRQGEIASQRWERISWVSSRNWTGHTWLIATSWDTDTKNGQDRVQALIPMAARLLHRWWQAKVVRSQACCSRRVTPPASDHWASLRSS